MLELLAEEGESSIHTILNEIDNRNTKDPKKYYRRDPQTIREVLWKLSDDSDGHPLIEIIREKQSEQGRDEKFYCLTTYGVEQYLLNAQPNKERFWIVLMVLSNPLWNFYAKTKITSKHIKNVAMIDGQKIIEKRERKYPINIIELEIFYEEKILKIHRDYFYSYNVKIILNHFLYETEKDHELFEVFFPILRIFGENGKLNYSDLMARLPVHTKSDEDKYFDLSRLMFQKGLLYKWNDGNLVEEYSLSVFGLLLLFDLLNQKYLTDEKKFALWQKRRINEIKNPKERQLTLDGFQQKYPEIYDLIVEPPTKNEKKLVKEIKQIIKYNHYLLPLIFSEQNFQNLKKEINQIEIILTLVDQFFVDIERTEGAHEQKNELLLLHSIEGIRRIYSLELQRFYRIGLRICSSYARQMGCRIPITNNVGILLSNEAVSLSLQTEYQLDDSKSLGYDEQDLKIFYGYLWMHVYILYNIEIKLNKSNTYEYELSFNSLNDYQNRSSSRSVTNVVSFEFFTRLKMEFPDKWKIIMENLQLTNWYNEWLEKIQNFDDERKEILNSSRS